MAQVVEHRRCEQSASDEVRECPDRSRSNPKVGWRRDRAAGVSTRFAVVPATSSNPSPAPTVSARRPRHIRTKPGKRSFDDASSKFERPGRSPLPQATVSSSGDATAGTEGTFGGSTSFKVTDDTITEKLSYVKG